MDLLKLGASLLQQHLSGNDAEGGGLSSALGKLLGGENGEGGLDLQGLVERMMGGETSDSLTEIAQSWLGDGENKPIEPDQVKELLGEDKLREVAQDLGQDENSLAGMISQVLPDLVDKNSAGGSLLDSIDMGSVGDMLKKLF